MARDRHCHPEVRAPSWDELDALPSACAVFVRCLLIRSEYGGLNGDMRIMETATRGWYDRFESVPGPFASTSCQPSSFISRCGFCNTLSVHKLHLY